MCNNTKYESSKMCLLILHDFGFVFWLLSCRSGSSTTYTVNLYINFLAFNKDTINRVIFAIF